MYVCWLWIARPRGGIEKTDVVFESVKYVYVAVWVPELLFGDSPILLTMSIYSMLQKLRTVERLNLFCGVKLLVQASS